ncbi:ribonuclease H1-like isoform X2 [Zophobas morio]|uniref:ribonuclease H1-like isoform X2 n=1 Tax=Zophobas morio TaxID=2755281 RepID=UPI003082CFA7
MFVYAVNQCMNCVIRRFLPEVFVLKFRPSVTVSVMELNGDYELTSGEVNTIFTVFKRIQQAKSQAESLTKELTCISAEIEKIQNWPMFRRCHLNNIHTLSAETNGPAPKRAKYDFPQADDGYVKVYTDGACENNGKPNAKAGIGVWFQEDHPLNISKPVDGKATNNNAEIQACIHAVQVAKDCGIDKVEIITDSQFTINAMTNWIKNWKKNNWKLAGGKGDVKNKSDFKKLDQLCQGLQIRWVHVRGHTGIKGNEMADELARKGARLYKPPC